MLCHKCYGEMVEVIVAKRSGMQYRMIVCVECGRIVIKDKAFRNVA